MGRGGDRRDARLDPRPRGDGARGPLDRRPLDGAHLGHPLLARLPRLLPPSRLALPGDGLAPAQPPAGRGLLRRLPLRPPPRPPRLLWLDAAGAPRRGGPPDPDPRRAGICVPPRHDRDLLRPERGLDRARPMEAAPHGRGLLPLARLLPHLRLPGDAIAALREPRRGPDRGPRLPAPRPLDAPEVV